MKKRIIYLLLGLLLPMCSIFANDGLTKTNSKTAVPTKADNLENWLEGRVVGNAMMVNFNISQVEFNALVDQNNISKIRVDFFWKNHAGDKIEPVSSRTLENVSYMTPIENWSHEITPADTLNGYYMVQVALNEAECGPRVAIPIVIDTYEEEEEPIVVNGDTLDPDFYECGDIVPAVVLSTDLLQKENLGPLFFISNFPIYLDAGVTGDDGVYSGTGIVPLPFKKQVVKVRFTNVRVDRKHQIFEGEVVAESDSPALYPDFKLSVDTFNIGGDICLELPPDTLDIAQFGFDPVTGLTPDGEKYNDEGYYVGKDENGNNIILHKENDTPFNLCGCNIEGKGGEYNGKEYVCQPNCNTNEAATVFADSIKNSIGDSISNIIATLKTETLDSLSNLNCNVIRTDMRSLVNTLAYDSLFIFGIGGKYINKGMHLEFEKDPKALTVNVDRRAEAKELEDKHVDLYTCDKIEYRLETAITTLDALANDGTVSEDILEKIKNWSQYALDKYTNDPVKFKAWLIEQIKDLLETQSGIDGITAINPMFQNSNNPFQPRERWGYQPTRQTKAKNDLKSLFQYDRGYAAHNTTASSDNHAFFDNTFTLEDAAFEYLQGAEYINGVERVYYIEALVKQQFFNPTERSKYKQPVVVEKRDSANNRTIAIYLDSIVFTPNGATLDAYALIEDGESGRKLSFRGKRLHFGPSGLTGESKLSLGVDVGIRLNNSARLVIEGTPETNVAWDCNGFKSVSIDAYIEICRQRIIPLDPSTLDTIVGDESNYRLDFDIQKISGWLEFYAVADAPPFVVRNAPTIKWELSQMILDFSSTETPTFTPMTGYESPFYDGKKMAPGWKGFYVKSLEATLPKKLFNPNDASNTTTKTIEASDILIDDNGFTGGIGYSGDILSIEDGSIAGWPFSITNINLRILNNRLAGGGMEGQVNVPIFEDNLNYEAVIYPGDQYSFTVAVDSSLTAPLFLADVELNGDSKVTIGKIDGEFVAKATLSGRLEVDGSKDENAPFQLGLTKMCFQNFEVSNQSPYFSPGKWGIVKDNSRASDFKPDVGGFGIKVDSLLPYSPGDGKIGLGFNVAVIINDKFGIDAEGRLGLEGKLEEDSNGRQKWVYDRLKLSKLAVDASFPSTKIKGVVEWFDDTNENCVPSANNICWGKGFRGALQAEFEKFDLKVEAAAQFGKVADYKYFYVDALVHPGKLATGSGPLQLRGFGGGVSYHMDINQNEVSFSTDSTNAELPGIGESFSGSFYTPTDTLGLGLKATAIIAAGNESIFNGTVSLLALFNEGGGLNKIGIQGTGQMLHEIDLGIKPVFEKGKSPDTSNVQASISAVIDLAYNFNEPSFHGDLEVYLVAGNGELRGAGLDNKMVDAELHFDSDKWYIHVGRPDKGSRAGIIAQIPGLGEGLHLDAYMQVGTQTDPMPPIPANVAAIAYKINRNKSLRTSGAGFILGASIGFKLEAEIAKVVKATLEAEAGFDIMLRKYNGVSCADTGKPIGIDGWYATGQMYAYAYGKLNVFGVDVAEAGIAAVLQARLPNPFFAQATVGVKVKIGPIKAKKSLKLTLGKDCVLVDNGNSALGMEVISYLNPSAQEANVETNAQPEAFFALSLDRNYDIAGLSETNPSKYRVSLVETKLIDSEGIPLGHDRLYNEDRTSVRAIPNNTFPANDSVTFQVTVRVFKNGDFLVDEIKSNTFATADALTYIPETNVKSAYPADGMVNFYRKEYSQQEGYIQLVTGQSELFNNLPEGTTQFIKLTSANTSAQTINFSYTNNSNRITFPLDGDQLQAGDLYKLEVMQVDGNPSTTTSPADETPSTADNVAVSNSSEEVLYTLYFRVSEYATFKEKLDAVMGTTVRLSEGTIFHRVPEELFDALEVNGNSKYNALIEFETDLNNNWLKSVKARFEDLEKEAPCSENYPSFEDLQYSVGLSFAAAQMDANKYNEGSIVTSGRQIISFELEKLVEEFYQLRKAEIYACGGGDEGSLMADCIDANAGGGLEVDICNDRIDQINRGYGVFPRKTPFSVWVTYSLPDGVETTNTEISFEKT